MASNSGDPEQPKIWPPKTTKQKQEEEEEEEEEEEDRRRRERRGRTGGGGGGATKKQNLHTGFATKHKIGQHPELSGAVPTPVLIFIKSKLPTGTIKSFILPFCVNPTANSTELRAGPDYKRPGVWGLENMV